MLTVAVVPARGGSKGLPRKNVRMLAGLPLVAHSIAAGRDAARVDRVYVSTEDAEIARIAREHGAAVIDRPTELATDEAQNDAVMRHALETMQSSGLTPDILVLLQPTSPLRTAMHVDACLDVFLSSGARSAMSICPVDHHPNGLVRLDNEFLYLCADELRECRRQEAATQYRRNGAIFVTRADDLMQFGRLVQEPCAGYVMNRECSIDIDDEFDMKIAELVAGNSIGV